MATINKPANTPALCPYFLIPDAEKFRLFLQTVFGATEAAVYRNDEGGIMHAEMRIDDSMVMFANSTGDYPPATGSVFMYVADADTTFRKALAEGATAVQEPEDKDYGRSAGLKDPFGNTWWITRL